MLKMVGKNVCTDLGKRRPLEELGRGSGYFVYRTSLAMGFGLFAFVMMTYRVDIPCLTVMIGYSSGLHTRIHGLQPVLSFDFQLPSPGSARKVLQTANFVSLACSWGVSIRLERIR
jgi:hypothetical protein